MYPGQEYFPLFGSNLNFPPPQSGQVGIAKKIGKKREKKH